MLKKKYGILWFILSIISCNLSAFWLGSLLDVYDENSWYTKWYYWVLGILCGFIPALIMLFIFNLQITNKICVKLGVAGSEIYNYPYVWILSFVIPFVGWVVFITLIIYTRLWSCVRICEGAALENS